MRKIITKNCLLMVVLVAILFSCKKEQPKIVKEADNYTSIRTAFGIKGYSNIKRNNNIVELEVNGIETEVNGSKNSLDGSKFVIQKDDATVFITLIKADGAKSVIRLNRITKTILYNDTTISEIGIDTLAYGDGDCVPFGSCPNARTEFTSMMFVASDPIVTQSNNETVIIDIDDNPTPPAPCNAYYGYTVGWGFTSTESKHHEGTVRNRNSTKNNLSTYRCSYLGTDTSCIFETTGCITISTFRCCK